LSFVRQGGNHQGHIARKQRVPDEARQHIHEMGVIRIQLNSMPLNAGG
jgi:hypothetical protein